MFFKELACHVLTLAHQNQLILFSYQCSFALECFAFQQVCLSVICISNSLILSCAVNFVNNFFQLFLILFSLFQRRLLKLVNSCCFMLFIVVVFSNLGYYTPKYQQKSTIFFNFFSKWHFDQTTQFLSIFLYILHNFTILSKILRHSDSFLLHTNHSPTP